MTTSSSVERCDYQDWANGDVWTCGETADKHTPCPDCIDGEIPSGEGYPKPCYGCITGLSPHAHKFKRRDR